MGSSIMAMCASISALMMLLCLAELIAMRSQGRAGWFAAENMPPELQSARLLLNESELVDRCGRTIRVDQVFELPGGELVVVDTKTRRRHEIRQADVEQIKRYRAALRDVYGRRLAPRAYVRTVIQSYAQSHREVRYNPIVFS